MDRDEARAAALLDRRTTALATRAGRGPRAIMSRPAGAPPAEARPAEARQSFIVWSVGESLFATEAGAVAGVIVFAGCARVPTREAACLGVIGRAGRFYSVIGMRRLIGLSASDAEPRHLLLLHGPAPFLALAVDRVLGRFNLAFPSNPDTAISFDGRLAAPFGPAELRRRLGLSSPAILPVETSPS